MDTRHTLCRIGADTTPLLLQHREDSDAHPTPAVWVSAPVPLSIDEVAALLYASLAPEEARAATDHRLARDMVADAVVNSGCQVVTDACDAVARQRHRLHTAHWSQCLRLAHHLATGTEPATGAVVPGQTRHELIS
ncbi:MAG: hypothetical protein ACR2GH_07200 [Pseudonocardia sp.]